MSSGVRHVSYLYEVQTGSLTIFYFQMEPTTEFTVKLRGAPFNVKEVSAVKTLLTSLRRRENSLQFTRPLSVTATNPRVHDSAQARSNQDREERERKPNRLVTGSMF